MNTLDTSRITWPADDGASRRPDIHAWIRLGRWASGRRQPSDAVFLAPVGGQRPGNGLVLQVVFGARHLAEEVARVGAPRQGQDAADPLAHGARAVLHRAGDPVALAEVIDRHEQ